MMNVLRICSVICWRCSKIYDWIWFFIFFLLEHFLMLFSRWWFLEKQPRKFLERAYGVLWIFLSFHLEKFWMNNNYGRCSEKAQENSSSKIKIQLKKVKTFSNNRLINCLLFQKFQRKKLREDNLLILRIKSDIFFLLFWKVL